MEEVTLYDFLRHKTQALELCEIREYGWTVATVWIDHEDLFMVPEKLMNRKVKSHSWGNLTIVDESGNRMCVPCHTIDV